MSLRRRIGALIYDWPRYRRAVRSGRWELMHNRAERVATDGRGVRCDWRFTSDLHIAKVYPSTGRRLMELAFAQWPVVFAEQPSGVSAEPSVSFVIGHRGEERVPLLLQTLRSIAGQQDVAFECIVVEQAAAPAIDGRLPAWCRYLFTKCDTEYNRAAAFNEGVRAARGAYVVLHDNDIVVPARYAAEVAAGAHDFADYKRFLFNFDAHGALASIMQNAQGGSIAVRREVFFRIGGFDEEFVGWGGEDNDFWDRAETTGRTFRFGYLPMIHLYHPPQGGKLAGDAAPALRRYREMEKVAPEERIRRLHDKLAGG